MGPYPRVIEAAITYTPAQTSTLPYEFNPLPIGTPTHQVIPDFTGIPFINSVGSTALTVFSMLDALSFLGILVVLLLSIKILWWLYGFVTEQPVNESFNMSDTLDIYGASYGAYYEEQTKIGLNPYNEDINVLREGIKQEDDSFKKDLYGIRLRQRQAERDDYLRNRTTTGRRIKKARKTARKAGKKWF